MSIQNKTATQILASIFAMAGIYSTANASDINNQKMGIDDQTAAQIIRSLAVNNSDDLESILNASSIEDLSPEQKATLLKIVQESAVKLHTANKPMV